MSKWSEPSKPMYYVKASDDTLTYGPYGPYGPYESLSTAKACITQFRKQYHHRNSRFSIEKHISTCVAIIDVAADGTLSTDRPALKSEGQPHDDTTSD